MLTNIYQIHPEILASEISKEFKSYRAKQVLDWLYGKFTYLPEEMTNLPKELKEWLLKHYSLSLPEIDLKLV
jgi:adenine C2-methylase RlmN of 23S rRNA A2503 and tRNA A37